MRTFPTETNPDSEYRYKEFCKVYKQICEFHNGNEDLIRQTVITELQNMDNFTFASIFDLMELQRED